MKRYFLLLIAMLGGVVLSLAEMNIYVYKKDGTIEKYEASEVDSIGFVDKENTHNGYEYVDLGLSVKWATMNVGAIYPEDYGDYFAWGETEPKLVYDWDSYKWCDGNHKSLTKYCANSDYGVVDNKNVLEFDDDVASVAFGGEWRIPTIAECEQLLDENNCLWTWTTQNNVKGFLVTSKINGNTIFLPAAGFCSSEVNGIGNFGAYCVNSIAYAGQVQISSNCYYLRFHSNAKGLDNQGRCVGICIRPVLSTK